MGQRGGPGGIVQFIGPYLEDLTAIGFAALTSEAFGLKAEVAKS